MRVFLIDAEHDPHTLRTKRMIERAEPAWTVEIVGQEAAVTLNMRLEREDEPFFATIPCGDGWLTTPELLGKISATLSTIPADACGIAAPDAGGTLEPLVWRTRFAKSRSARPFNEALPFPRYAAKELFGALGEAGRWVLLEPPARTPVCGTGPRWRNFRREAELIEPLIGGRGPVRSGGEQPLVTFALSTFNDGRYVDWAIESVLRQHDPRWALIIVDDGSTDGTSERLRRYDGIEGVSVLRLPANRGKAAALNRALEAVRTPWLMELDADDWLPADAAARLAGAAARADADTGFLYAGCHEWTERHNGQLVYRGDRLPEPEASLAEWIARAVPVVPRIYRTDRLLQLGGWPTDGPGGGRLYEDFEMLARLSGKTRFKRIPGCLYHRRLRAGSVTRTHASRYQEWKRRMLETYALTE